MFIENNLSWHRFFFGENKLYDQALNIVNQVASYRKRGIRLSVLSGLLWSTGTGFFLFTLIIAFMGWWGDWEKSNSRIIIIVLVISIVSAIAWWLFLKPILKLTRPNFTGRLLDSFSKEKSGGYDVPGILSAYQLAIDALKSKTIKNYSSKKNSNHFNFFNKNLLLRHFQVTLITLSALKPKSVFPVSRLKFSFAVFILGLTAVVSFRYNEPFWYQSGVDAILRDTGEYSKKVAKSSRDRSLLVRDLTLTKRYPEYLKRKDLRYTASSGGFSAPVGTVVFIEGVSLVPNAVSGNITLENGVVHPLSIDNKGRIKGRMVVNNSGTFELNLSNSKEVKKGLKRIIEIEKDAFANVKIVNVPPLIQMDAESILELQIEASDDHGIDSLDILIQKEDGKNIQKKIFTTADEVSSLKTSFQFSPGDYSLKGEKKIFIKILAFDNDMISGPKKSVSNMLEIGIITPGTRHLNAIAEQRKVLNKLVYLLGERLEKPPVRKNFSLWITKEFDRVTKETEELLSYSARVIHRLAMDSLTPGMVTMSFASLREKLSNQLLFETRLYKAPRPVFEKCKSAHMVTVNILEDAVVTVDNIILSQNMTKMVETSQKLSLECKEVSRFISNYFSNRLDSSRRKLVKAISKLKRHIRKLQSEIDSIATGARDVFYNTKMMTNADLSGMLDELVAMISKGKLAMAHKLMNRLKNDIDRVMASLESGLLSFRTQHIGEGQKFLDNILEKVMGFESVELQVKRTTTAVRRRYRERLVDIMRKKIDLVVQRQLRRVEKVRSLLENTQIPQDKTKAKELIRFRVTAWELKASLEQGDLEEGRLLVNEIKSDMEYSMKVLNGNSVYQAAYNHLKILAENMSKVFPKPGQILHSRDKGRIKTQTLRQRHVMFQVRRFKIKIGNEKDKTLFVTKRVIKALEKVILEMSMAVSHMEKLEITQAVFRQNTILDKLAALRSDLKYGRYGIPIENQPVSLGTNVKIPEPDEYKVPPEFRDDIINAMHQELPQSYRGAIKKYYELLME